MSAATVGLAGIETHHRVEQVMGVPALGSDAEQESDGAFLHHPAGQLGAAPTRRQPGGVGVEHPLDRRSLAAVIPVRSASVATSGTQLTDPGPPTG